MSDIKKHYEFTRNQIKCLYEACRFINKQSINFNLDFEVNFYELKEMFWKDLEELDYKENEEMKNKEEMRRDYTGDLRFVVRNGMRILQRETRIEYARDSKYIWEDIPTAIEENPDDER